MKRLIALAGIVMMVITGCQIRFAQKRNKETQPARPLVEKDMALNK